ncbi:MAG TPA: FixH family protein [Gemmatimonadaceae bacterium]|nr:FixH family protein [Gemmatimonadaceae bacterium]
MRTAVRLVILLSAALAVAGCTPSKRTLDNRQWSDTYAFRITVEPMPPRAIEDATYKIVVQDKKTGEPIETGEGRIFATSKDGANTDDGLAKGKEIGTYYGRLFFPTTGDWAIAIQFRRESRLKLERVDWVQSVRNATGPG